MKKEGLSVDDLFSQCVFHHDEKDMVLKAVHAVHPEYQPQIQQTTSQFSLPLVNDFYTQVLHPLFHHRLFAWKDKETKPY